METTLAPVLLFCYKRSEVLKQTIAALQKNTLAPESELYIFSDGAKTPSEEAAVREVRNYLKSISGFKKVQVVESAQNKGLANSIIGGVSRLFEEYDRVIVLEDDLLTSTNFLSFMNQALAYYANLPVFSVAGFSFPITGLPPDSVYFTMRASSWGWATWKDRWEGIDWEVKNYASFKSDARQRKEFNRMGSDLSLMLDKCMKRKIDSWAIRWCFHQFQIKSYTVHPVVSKVQNAGFGGEATHTNEVKSRYATVLDNTGNTRFSFSDSIGVVPAIIRQSTKRHSIRSRIFYKLINLVVRPITKYFPPLNIFKKS